MMMMALMMIVETMKMAITMGMAPSIPGSKVAVGEDTLLFMLRIRDIGDGHQFPGYTSTGHFGVCKISPINAKLVGGHPYFNQINMQNSLVDIHLCNGYHRATLDYSQNMSTPLEGNKFDQQKHLQKCLE